MNASAQPPDNLNHIEGFFANLAKPDRDSASKRFSYVAVRKGESWNLLRGRLDFNPLPRTKELPVISSDLVRAGTVDLTSVGLTPHTLLDQLLGGSINLSGDPFNFAKGSGSHHSMFYMPNVNGNKVDDPIENRLQIGGQQNHELFDFTAVKLDLKSVPGFHGSLSQLLTLYDLRPDWEGGGVWFVGLPIIELIRYHKRQTGAEIELRLRNGFDTEGASLGIRYSYKNADAPALTFSSGAFAWSEGTSGARGIMRLVLPQPTELELIVMHGGKPQHVAHPEL